MTTTEWITAIKMSGNVTAVRAVPGRSRDHPLPNNRMWGVRKPSPRPRLLSGWRAHAQHKTSPNTFTHRWKNPAERLASGGEGAATSRVQCFIGQGKIKIAKTYVLTRQQGESVSQEAYVERATVKKGRSDIGSLYILLHFICSFFFCWTLREHLTLCGGQSPERRLSAFSCHAKPHKLFSSYLKETLLKNKLVLRYE